MQIRGYRGFWFLVGYLCLLIHTTSWAQPAHEQRIGVGFGSYPDGSAAFRLIHPVQVCWPHFEQDVSGRVTLTFADAPKFVLSNHPAMVSVAHRGTPVQSYEFYSNNERPALRLKMQTNEWGMVVTKSADQMCEIRIFPAQQAMYEADQRLSLSLNRIDIKALTQLITDFSGEQVTVDEAIHGDVGVMVKNVPWSLVLNVVAEQLNAVISYQNSQYRLNPR